MTPYILAAHDPVVNLLAFLALSGGISMVTLARTLLTGWSEFARTARQGEQRVPNYRKKLSPARFARA